MKSTIILLLCTVAALVVLAAASPLYSREELLLRDKERRDAALRQSEEDYHKKFHQRQEKHLKTLRQSRPAVHDKPTDPGDRAALEALYQSTKGPQWSNHSNWMQGDPCASPYWFGVYCLGGRVLELNLAYNELDGELPQEISQLTALQVVRAYSNGLTGEIPHDFFEIRSLQIVDFNSNSLTGTLPGEISLVNLTQLALYSNQIKGNFPSTFYAPKLQTLDISDNLLAGYLPVGLGESLSLTELIVSRNMFYGSLPSSYGAMTKLQILWTFLNNLDDSAIPSEYHQMRDLVNVQMDSLSGPFPSWIGTSWTKVQYLVLVNGKMSGSLPSSICNLNEVVQMRMFNNSFTGKLPDCICKIQTLVDFEVSDNVFTGSIPDNFDDCKVMESLYLSRNNLTGKFPASFGRMPSLTVLDVSSNGLYGIIPNSVNGLKETIAQFSICYNMFSDIESDLTPFFQRIVDYSCLFYNNPWSCPLSATIPKDCSATCSDCNTKKSRGSCSVCVSSSTGCGWCGLGQNCLDGTKTGSELDYRCPSSQWKYGQC